MDAMDLPLAYRNGRTIIYDIESMRKTVFILNHSFHNISVTVKSRMKCKKRK